MSSSTPDSTPDFSPAARRDAAREASLFPRLSDADIACLSPFGVERTLSASERLFAEGEPARTFYVVLDGAVEVTRAAPGGATTLTVHHTGEFTGELSLLAGGAQIASAQAAEPSRVLAIPAEALVEALTTCRQLMGVILSALVQRVPDADALLRQREKLASLGTLAAGLAHELNNPATAARRAAAQLRQALHAMREEQARLLDHGLDPGRLATLAALPEQVEREASARAPLDPLAQGDREQEVADWLDAHGVADGWRLAPRLVAAGLETAQLERLRAQFDGGALADGLRWLAAALDVSSLAGEVERSATRISELVQAVKRYTYMDQAPMQEVDLRADLENALTLLRHKLSGVVVTREYAPDVPAICAFGGELNQVWTNLLDNAIDAARETQQATDGPHIWVRTRREGESVVVEIADNGPGVAPERQARIFDPFFTTKEVGKGTGLGLDISYRIVVTRHHGDLSLVSQPGETRFLARLPISQP